MNARCRWTLWFLSTLCALAVVVGFIRVRAVVEQKKQGVSQTGRYLRRTCTSEAMPISSRSDVTSDITTFRRLHAMSVFHHKFNPTLFMPSDSLFRVSNFNVAAYSFSLCFLPPVHPYED